MADYKYRVKLEAEFPLELRDEVVEDLWELAKYRGLNVHKMSLSQVVTLEMFDKALDRAHNVGIRAD